MMYFEATRYTTFHDTFLQVDKDYKLCKYFFKIVFSKIKFYILLLHFAVHLTSKCLTDIQN